MSTIFVSWGSPDAAVVKPLLERLRQFGFTIKEYSDNMSAGDSIPHWIMHSIEGAQLALLFVSEKTAKRDWILSEAAWCYERHCKDGLPLLPVSIGEQANVHVPQLLRNAQLRISNVPAVPSEADIFRLAQDVCDKLEGIAPIVVPAALLAMTRAQFDALVTDPLKQESLSPLCAAAGMKAFPDLAADLRSRYGEKPEDFSPFPKQTLVSMVQDSLQAANVQRVRAGRPPVWVRWCNDDLASDDPKVVEEIWDRCVSGGMMAIVDSVSLLLPEIQNTFLQLPVPRDSNRSALLWVPPYTTHTCQFESFAESISRSLKPLWGKCMRWKKEDAEPYLAFDIATSASLRRWMYRAFGDLVPDMQPQERNIADMRGIREFNGSIAQMWATSKR